MCFLYMRSWGWASASKCSCLKTRSDTSCDCLQRVDESLKGWALAVVKQRVWGKRYHQRGPCLPLFWTNTVGPPSGWVPQPGSMLLEMRRDSRKKPYKKDSIVFFSTFAKWLFVLWSGQYLRTLISSVSLESRDFKWWCLNGLNAVCFFLSSIEQSWFALTIFNQPLCLSCWFLSRCLLIWVFIFL